MAPSMCGSIVSSHRSLLSLIWSVVTLLSFGAFVTAALFAMRIEGQYNHLAAEYRINGYNADYYQWYEEHCGDRQEQDGRMLEDGDSNSEDREGESGDHESEGYECGNQDSWEGYINPYEDADWPNSYYPTLASTSSFGVKFAALYTATLAVALSLYGSMAVVGFSSIRGQYIAPCFGGGGGSVDSARRARIRLGAFMGCLIFFANLCVLIAVLLGEFRVRKMGDGIKSVLKMHVCCSLLLL
uniref:Uncharacterized protein n=1 Tax=Odontella aurita TaxID=265563 RepID=A0A7S4JI85_9STRA|mmetsp:Transcript_46897/g.142065  ORF Transcript_46897/g.142065 Transcript_46897/m.142065 type:complete len:242 (+) Transcript_46897:848-1573(+)